jgi:signal transduction histidine kinase
MPGHLAEMIDGPFAGRQGLEGRTMLSSFLTKNREILIVRAREKVVKRRVPLPTDYELSHGVPLFIDQLAETLKQEARGPNAKLPEMTTAAVRHGRDLLDQGFSVGQVVHDYGDICQAVTELALETNSPITTDEFHTLNRCLDNATAEAVTEYGRQRDLRASGDARERMGSLAHELRTKAQVAVLSFQLLRKGTVGIGGSTGHALERTLHELVNLVDRAIVDVKLDANAPQRAAFPLAQLLDEVAFQANLEAQSREIQFNVAPLETPVNLEADRQLLSSALSNLLQNAIQFTKPAGKVWLRALAGKDRVVIEVEDQCGGLPPGKADELFLPFAQRTADRSGLGLGLAISRRVVEQSGGKIGVRNSPGKGCVFTVELPVKTSGSGSPNSVT